MESTREIYWNIGHGVVIPMYLLTLVAFGIMAWGFWQRSAVWRQGRGLDRFDRFDERVKRLVSRVLSQEKVARVKGGGIPHALFFWGFLTLFAGTMVVMLQADFFAPLMRVNILTGGFYEAFSLSLDLAGLVAIVMLAALFIRRFMVKPAGLETVNDDYIVHQLLFAILVTGFCVEGARMAATELQQNPALARFSPGGYLFAHLFTSYTDDSIRTVHKVLWWTHFALVLGFIAALPYTKLRHILTTAANSFFAPLEEKGTIATLNLEDEGQEQFGATKVTDLTWKDIFDADACTGCARCQERCPAAATEKPLSPMKVVQQVGEAAWSAPGSSLLETVTADALWSCTTCRACQDVCPAEIEHVNKIVEMRRSLSLMEGEFPGDEVRTAVSNVEVNGNPFGLAYAGRGDWAEGLPVARVAEGEEADILYFAGCYASFDRRNREVARSFVKICAAAGIRVGILGKDEKCCGEPVRKLGNEYLYQMVAAENIEAMQASGAKKVVTTCPHCFNTLSRDYRDLGFGLETEHYATFIHGLIRSGRLALSPAAERFPVTYHDSCYLGRYKDIFAEPRAVLAAAGGDLREMERAGGDSFCCGAGGGRILAEEKLGTKISEARVRMAEESGAPLLVANCPFCLTMFEDGIKTGGFEGSMRVRDLAEIVAERLQI
ncbi:heterodisulfide reductase-related iron-sulfur binding cluster [Geobacter pickeringii]|uniref:Electron transporter n=1 Tax=Geobacter pickeringii TaxID=345632 RepID=A0A0B5BDY7_9BACT|nr:heterodisulfide reductase-related iron-sulfur binding cluster [Geobacter pickeringii]AJE04697.1 electron transporter [Geobacter pickeringii]